MHGWSLDAAVETDDAHGPIIHTVAGGLSMTGMIVDHCIIENSELTGIRQNGVAIREVNTIRYSILHDISSAILFVGDLHDCIIYNINYPAGNETFDVAYHTNVTYFDAWNGAASCAAIPAYCYNNVIYNVNCGSSPIYPSTGYDATFYIYNNLVYGVNGSNMCVQIDPYGGSGDLITVHVYNNTFLMPNGIGNAVYCVDRGGNPRTKNVIMHNNHIIGTDCGEVGGSYAAETHDHDLIQTAAAAAAQGYEVGNLYAPTSVSGSTVDGGVDATAILTTDRLGKTRILPFDIGGYEYIASVKGGGSEMIPILMLQGMLGGR
jgi:hypothetical protein